MHVCFEYRLVPTCIALESSVGTVGRASLFSRAAVPHIASHELSKRCAKQTREQIVDGNEREVFGNSLERIIREAPTNELPSRTVASTFVGLLLSRRGQGGHQRTNEAREYVA